LFGFSSELSKVYFSEIVVPAGSAIGVT